jgi:predicted hydrocarbon binding protein
MNKIKSFIYKIESSQGVYHFLTILQIVAAAAGTFYTNKLFNMVKPSSRWLEFFKWTFLVFFATALVILIFRSILAIKLRIIKFSLKSNGYLMDLRAGFRNVSLRAASVRMILNYFIKPISSNRQKREKEQKKLKKKLFNAGKEIGSDFYTKLSESLKGKGAVLDIEDKINYWFKYDSSSGMGRFKKISFVKRPAYELVFEILNPFIYDNDTCDTCDFLRGYIMGFCEKLFAKEVLIVEERCAKNTSDDDSCQFKITKKLTSS